MGTYALVGQQADNEIADGLAAQEALKTTILAKNATITEQAATIAAQAAEIARLTTPTPPVPPAPVLPFTVPTGYALDKYDAFTGDVIDPTKWNVRTGKLNPPREEWDNPGAISMLHPGLRITTERKEIGGMHWSSGYIDSKGFMEFGMDSHIEVKWRMDDIYDNAAGIWPCPLWLRGDWPGEIDNPELYGWPFLNPARTVKQSNDMRGSISATVHESTMGTLQKTVRQSPPVAGGLIKPGVWHTSAIRLSNADGISLFFDGQPFPDAWGRPVTMSWPYLDSIGIPKSSFVGTGHARIQTQVGSSYWGPSNAQTKSPFHMDLAYFFIARKV